MAQDTTVIDVFRKCVTAIREGKLIRRESRQDKEFHCTENGQETTED